MRIVFMEVFCTVPCHIMFLHSKGTAIIATGYARGISGLVPCVGIFNIIMSLTSQVAHCIRFTCHYVINKESRALHHTYLQLIAINTYIMWYYWYDIYFIITISPITYYSLPDDPICQSLVTNSLYCFVSYL
mgnify:CR=1 FL=1